MTESEFLKGLTYLGLAYKQEFSKTETEVYYDFLKEYSYQTFVNAIKNIIKTSKFLPKINEIIEACESCKEHIKFEVLEYMNNAGYFKSPIEYEKATLFMERGVVPSWLQEDINKYYKNMLGSRLEHKEQLLIG